MPEPVEAQQPPKCANCGEPMRMNVPRMGWDGGAVHAVTGYLICEKPFLAIKALEAGFEASLKLSHHLLRCHICTLCLGAGRNPCPEYQELLNDMVAKRDLANAAAKAARGQ